MELIALFKDFGYPAIISGVLIWIIVTRLEALRATNVELVAEVSQLSLILTTKMDEMEKQVEANAAMHGENRQIVEENRRSLATIMAVLKIKKGGENVPSRPRD